MHFNSYSIFSYRSSSARHNLVQTYVFCLLINVWFFVSSHGYSHLAVLLFLSYGFFFLIKGILSSIKNILAILAIYDEFLISWSSPLSKFMQGLNVQGQWWIHDEWDTYEFQNSSLIAWIKREEIPFQLLGVKCVGMNRKTAVDPSWFMLMISGRLPNEFIDKNNNMYLLKKLKWNINNNKHTCHT